MSRIIFFIGIRLNFSFRKFEINRKKSLQYVLKDLLLFYTFLLYNFIVITRIRIVKSIMFNLFFKIFFNKKM